MKRNKVQRLPQAVRDWLDSALINGNFSDYAALAEALRVRGYEISKSGLQRYGTEMERRLAAVRDTTRAMEMLNRVQSGDDESKSGGLMALIQSDIFKSLLAIKAIEDEADADPLKRAATLSLIGKNAAATVRASLEVQKHQKASAQEEEAAVLPPAPTIEVRFVGKTPKNAPEAPEQSEGV